MILWQNKNYAIQRRALPHIGAILPSEFNIFILTIFGLSVSVKYMIPSAPTPSFLLQSLPHIYYKVEKLIY